MWAVYICVCVGLCADMCLAHRPVSTSCALLLRVQSSPIRTQWELSACMCLLIYTYASVCGLEYLTLHLHVICVCKRLCISSVCVPSFQSNLRTSHLMCWLDSARWNQSLLCFNFTPVCLSVTSRATGGGNLYTVWTSEHHLRHQWDHTHGI